MVIRNLYNNQRLVLPKFVLPKADKAEAEGCQDPRQSFFLSMGNMSI